MKSKNSLCNKAIIKNDFHRFGPLIVICTIFFQLLLVTPLFSKLISVNYETNDFAIGELINTARNLSLPIIPLLAGVIVPMLLFNYINTERETYTIHALPLTRTSLFFSHYVFGLAIIYIPMVLAYMGLIFVNAYFRCHALLGVLGSLLLAIIEYFFFYNMGCMVMMLCGNSVIAFVVHFVLNFIFYALVYLTDNLQLMLPVYSAFTFNVFQKMQLLNPIVFFRKFPVFTSNFYGDPFYTDSFHYKSLLCIAISLIPAVGFLIIGLLLYKKRHIETVGEFMAFRFADTAFRFVFTFFASTITGVMTTQLLLLPVLESLFTRSTSYISSAILILLISPFYYVIATMILEKSFRVRSVIKWKGYILSAAVLVIYMYTSQMIEFRYDIPKLSDKAYVNMSYFGEDYEGYVVYELSYEDFVEFVDILEIQQFNNKKTPRELNAPYMSHINFVIDYSLNDSGTSDVTHTSNVGINLDLYDNETYEVEAFMAKKATRKFFQPEDMQSSDENVYLEDPNINSEE